MSAARAGRLPQGSRARRLTLTLSHETWEALAEMASPHSRVFLGQDQAERYFAGWLIEQALKDRGYAPRGKRRLAHVLQFPPTPPVA